MSKKKFTLVILGIIVVFLGVFELSYNLGLKKYNLLQNNSRGEKLTASELDKLTLNANAETAISPNSKVTLKIIYMKSGDVDSREMSSNDFAGKSKDALEKQGYEVESITKNEAILIKKVDTYAPNKYVLGVKGNCYAIYKTDASGNMFIENESSDITNIKVQIEGEYNSLVKGNKRFQYNTREELEEKLGELST